MFDSGTNEEIEITNHDHFINWFFEEFHKQKEHFEASTNGKEKYTLESAFSRFGFDDPLNPVCTVQFFDHRTRQLLELYEFHKYNPGLFSTSQIWRETVVTLRKLEPKGGLF